MSGEDRAVIATPEEIIAEARNGHMFILVDDEDRENEGDLVIPAQMATPDAINFMAKHGRGLICLALDGQAVDRLGLPLVARRGGGQYETAFTVSIEAREGVTTGISAADRARTIQVAIDRNAKARDIVSPGHVFPLAARHGGVLERAGHTEASVDIARLAGLNPSGVICEIMNDDGSMARLPDLVQVAQRHGLKIGTIADLIAYRRRTEKLVERITEAPFTSTHGGEFKLLLYRNTMTGQEHLALIKGDLGNGEPVLVRMHALSILDDVLLDASSKRTNELLRAMQVIGAAGRGALVLIRHGHETSLQQRIEERAVIHQRVNTGVQDYSTGQLRDYGVGAQILIDLGIEEMVLLSNSKRQIIGLEGYGLSIIGHEPIPDADPA